MRKIAVLACTIILAGCRKEEPANEPPSMDTAMTSTEITSTETAPPSGDAIFDEIKRRFSALSPGTVAFDVPQRMRVADTATVTLRIAPKGEERDVLQNLPATTTGPIEHVTPEMDVHLDGGDAFEIKDLMAAKQAVAGGGYAEWRWHVTPKESGRQQLVATVSAHLLLPGRQEVTRSVLTLERDVDVSFNFIDFINNHLEWLWGALIVPLAGWFFALFQRRRKRDNRK